MYGHAIYIGVTYILANGLMSCAADYNTHSKISSWECVIGNNTLSGPHPRRNHGLLYWNNRIYLVRGEYAEKAEGGWNNNCLQDVWYYDLIRNEWCNAKPGGALPSELSMSSMSSVNHELYLFGGRNAASYHSDGIKRAYLWKYEATSNSWNRMEFDTGPTPRISARVQCADYKIYVVNGNTLDNRPLREIWSLDMNARSWKLMDISHNGPELWGWPKDQVSGTAWAGTELVIFGSSRDGGYDNIWAYNSIREEWRHLPPPAHRPAFRAAPALVACPNGEVIMFGGYRGGEILTEGGLMNDLWKYNPTANLWTEIKVAGDLPEPRMTKAIIVGEYLYICGGVGKRHKYHNDIWKIRI